MILTTCRLTLACLGIFALLVGLVSCGKENAVNEVPEVEIKPVDFFSGNPGRNRIKLSWKVADPEAEKAVIGWNGDSETKEIPVEEVNDTMSVMLTDLQEGNQSFSVTLQGKGGASSKRSKMVARVYGDTYQQSLLPRELQNVTFSNGDVVINWSTPEQTALDTEVEYQNQQGAVRQIQVPADNDSTILENYSSGTAFRYRTRYLPEPSAIDSFYSDYATSENLSEQHTFTNPLMTKGADPWVVYKDGMYYFTRTTGSSIVLYATPRMSELGQAEPVKVWNPVTYHNVWAPELHYINNKWYVYFAADRDSVSHRMYVLENSSADPLTPNWEFKGKIADSTDQWAIDGTILSYNGQLYMLWSGNESGIQNIYIARMSSPLTLEGTRVRISTPTYEWEKNGNLINEGPQVLINPQGKLFVVYSASGFWTDDYSLGMLSLRDGGNPLDPSEWSKSSTPVFTRNDQASAYGPGHNGFFKSPDGTEDWIIYHARSYPGGGDTNYRNPRMQKFTWKADGTPDFGEPVAIGQEIPAPSGEY